MQVYDPNRIRVYRLNSAHHNLCAHSCDDIDAVQAQAPAKPLLVPDRGRLSQPRGWVLRPEHLDDPSRRPTWAIVREPEGLGHDVPYVPGADPAQTAQTWL